MKTVERVDDYGDDYGLQKKRSLLVHRSRRRSRSPKGLGKMWGRPLTLFDQKP